MLTLCSCTTMVSHLVVYWYIFFEYYRSGGLPQSAMEDICEDGYGQELGEVKDEFHNEAAHVKALKVKKA